MTLLNHSINLASAQRGVFVAIATGALALVAGGMLCGGSAQAQGASAIEVEEMKTALEVAQKQLANVNAKAAKLEKSTRVLGESLAESNRVAEETRAQYEELLLRMASFGVDLVKPDPKSLEQRLLQAVRDREQSEQRNQMLADRLATLSESVLSYLQTTVNADAQVQARVEAELAAANQAIGQINRPAQNSARLLTEGRVVSIDPEIGLLVLNVGRDSGVRIGMPISVKRDNQPIGTALIVQVRESITGALLQSIAGNGEVKVGDRIEPRTDSL
jgi:chromosome segregation ATPase